MSFIADALFGKPKAPDYTPLANASKESAEIMAQLGREQMAEGKRQYDDNKAAMQPILDTQLAIMKDSQAQASDLYNYQKNTFRPMVAGLVKDANEFNTTAAKEQFASRAVSDMEQAQAGEAAQTDRAMAAMGINPNSGRFAGIKRSGEIRSAAARAGAATGARIQADALGTQKRMDAVALGTGLNGFSSDANRTALAAGGGATNTQMAPGQAYMQSLGQGANTIGSGRSFLQNGLGSILNAQTSAYGTQANMRGQNADFAGTVAGFAASDRRLKENIVQIGVDHETGLPIYEFSYKDVPDRRYRGVMADEVESRFPDAVVYDDLGFASVNYGALGLQMTEVRL